MFDFTELPSGLDVYAVLRAALENPEYRDKLLWIAGMVWGTGFVMGFCLAAIFVKTEYWRK